MTALLLAWPVVAILLALAISKGIRIADARDRARSMSRHPAGSRLDDGRWSA